MASFALSNIYIAYLQRKKSKTETKGSLRILIGHKISFSEICLIGNGLQILNHNPNAKSLCKLTGKSPQAPNLSDYFDSIYPYQIYDSYGEIYWLVTFILATLQQQEMSGCCDSHQKEDLVQESDKLARNMQKENDIARQRQITVQQRNRPSHEDPREETRLVQKFQRDKQDLIVRHHQELTREKIEAKALRDKEGQFKQALQQDAVKYSKAVKQFMNEVDSAMKIGELQGVRTIVPSISFPSITEYFGAPDRRHSRINQISQMVVQMLSEVYGFFERGKILERGLLISVESYLTFLQEVISAGYSESLGDRQLKQSQAFMSENARQLYKRLQALLLLAKEKFTKDRSRILEETTVDSSHHEMKLRSKVEELQKQIQELLDENEKKRAANQLLSSTIAGLKEQLNRRELQAMENMSTALGELQRTVPSREEVQGHFQRLGRWLKGAIMAYSNEQMAEVIKSKDMAIEKMQAQLARMQKERSLFSDDTEPQRKQLAQELQERRMDIEGLNSQLRDKDDRIRIMEEAGIREAALSKLINEKLHEKQREIVSLRKMVEDLQKNIKRGEELQRQQAAKIPLCQQQNEIPRKTQQNLALISQLQAIRLRQQQKQSKFAGIQQYNLTLSTQVEALRGNRDELLRKLELSISQNNQLTAKMEKESRRFEQQLSEQQFRRSDAEMRTNQAQGQLLQVRDELAKTNRLRKELENQSAAWRFELGRARAEVSSLKEQIQRAKSQVESESYKNEIACLRIENEQVKEDLIKLHLMLEKIEMEKDQTTKALTNLREISMQTMGGDSHRMRTASFVQHRTLFIGDVLERRKGEKKYLMDRIEALMMLEIEKTKLLYEYKRDQKINFHNFIDGHSSIVLIVETEKAILGCYYSGVVREDAPMTEQALLFSLDSRKTYFLNTPKHNPNKDPKDTRLMRGMVYDKYFLIFGNAQLRIRTGQDGLFSNFGITSSYFDARKQKVDALLHQGNNNEVKMLNYEIHEVFFNEEFTLQTA